MNIAIQNTTATAKNYDAFSIEENFDVKEKNQEPKNSLATLELKDVAVKDPQQSFAIDNQDIKNSQNSSPKLDELNPKQNFEQDQKPSSEEPPKATTVTQSGLTAEERQLAILKNKQENQLLIDKLRLADTQQQNAMLENILNARELVEESKTLDVNSAGFVLKEYLDEFKSYWGNRLIDEQERSRELNEQLEPPPAPPPPKFEEIQELYRGTKLQQSIDRQFAGFTLDRFKEFEAKQDLIYLAQQDTAQEKMEQRFEHKQYEVEKAILNYQLYDLDDEIIIDDNPPVNSSTPRIDNILEKTYLVDNNINGMKLNVFI